MSWNVFQEELQINPFLRISEPDIVAFCGESKDPVDILAQLRRKKDQF